jgi:hypothetical protein
VNTSQPGVGIVLLFTSDYSKTGWGIEAYISPTNENLSTRLNKVDFEGRTYSTIADVPIGDGGHYYYNTQSYFARVPERWSLVYDLSPSFVTFLETSHNFGANMVVTGNGKAYMTDDQNMLIDDNPPSNGVVFSQGALLNRSGEYRCIISATYFCQILIVLDANANDDYTWHHDDVDDNQGSGNIFGVADNAFNTFKNVAIIMIVLFIVISTLIYM